MILLDAERLTASRPNRPLFTDVSLTLNDGDRVGVVGINGSGKTTLLRMLAGDARARGRRGASRTRRARRRARPVARARRPAPSRAAVGDGWQGEAMLDRLGMAALVDAPTTELSGGQAKRVALAELLAGEHDALILDEPTNHLDLDAIRFLEEWLADYRGGLRAGHPRPPRARPGDHQGARARPRRAPTSTCPPGCTPARATPRTSPAGPSARSRPTSPSRCAATWPVRELAWLRRGAPARTTKPKARIAAATAIVDGRPQAAARDGDLERRALGAVAAARLEGRRAGRRRLRLARRHAGARPDVAGARAGRPHRHRRAERRRQVDAARPRRRPAAADRRARRPRRDRGDRLLRPARPRARSSTSGCATPSPATRASRRSPTSR